MIESLSIAKNFVADARFNIVAPFKPEDIVLQDYDFVPYVRNGLSGAIKSAPAGQDLRAVVTVAFDVCGTGVAPVPVSRDLTLYGPGDIIGLDPGQIIRREPAPGTNTAEETFMAQIEFDRPDLPWMFSPLVPAGSALEPWLTLVVCLQARSKILPSAAPGLPQVLATQLGELQSLQDNAYFAHAQVVGGASPTIADRLSDEHALANLSRLICPRKLEPGRAYRAVLVPAFDCGVNAGLGKTGGTLLPAWTRAADGSDAESPIQLPVYDSWEFSTGPAGDFKSLAERLEPIGAPWQIGRRLIDCTQPGGGVDGAAPGTAGALQVLSCALRSPALPPAGGPGDTDPGWPAPLRDKLRERVEAANADTPLLPRVGPRLYARYQAGRNTIGAVFGTPPTDTTAADNDWFSNINTHPLSRIVAGLGTRVVQKDQELLMQAAWAQVSEINKLNHQIQQHQFAKLINESHMRRRIAALDLGEMTRLTRPLHGRIRIAARPDSLWKQIEDSRSTGSMLTITAKRVTSVSAPAMRKGMALRTMAKAPDFMTDDGRFRDQRLTYANPDGITAFADRGLKVLGPELVGRVLGVAPNVAFQTLRDRVAPLSRGTAVARLSEGVTTWNVEPGRAVGGLFAGYLAGRIDKAMPNAADGAAVLRAELAGAALSGLARVNAPGFAEASNNRIAALARAVPGAAVRRDIAANIQPGVRVGIATSIVTNTIGPISTGAQRTGDNILARRGPVVAKRVPPPAPNRPADPAPDPATRFETPFSRDLTRTLNALTAVKLVTLAQSFDATINKIAVPPARDTRTVPPLSLTAAQIVETLDPAKQMTAYLKGRVRQWPSLIRSDWLDDQRIDPVMAAPIFPRAMYEALDAYDRDWLVPGLGTIEQTDYVTLLEANPRFCETFLVGLSDEMGRELLWRNYPTDQRGTYFKRFWDAEQDELKPPIHRFGATALGTHMSIGGTSAVGFLPVVLVVRGAIVRRYPHAIIAAVKATSSAFPPSFGDGSEAEVLFHAHLEPDYLLVGFKLSAEQVRTENWWFLLAEHPTAPRFGMAEAPAGNPRSAAAVIEQDELDWNDLTVLAGGLPTLDRGQFLAPHARSVTIRDFGSAPELQNWPGSAAAVARTLLRDPVRAAFEGKSLLADISTAGGPHA